MLRVLSAASGDEVAKLPLESVSTAGELKRHLAVRLETSRFLLRLLCDARELHLGSTHLFIEFS